MDTDTNVGARVALEEYAMRCLHYALDRDASQLSEKDSYYLTDTYKRVVVEAMSPEQLLDIIMTNPTVTLEPSDRDTHFTASYAFKPLSNLVFMRDQQITTRKGIVFGRLSSAQRQNEVDLTKFCFRKLGFTIAGEIPEPGRLEGGDYFPAGPDLCFIGIGLRSNMEAVQYMMDNDLFGTRRVAVVRDDFEKDQDRMHLDCVFNILGTNLCLMYEDMIGEDSPHRRLVDEYVRDKTTKSYVKARGDVEFSRYAEENNYNIIKVSHADQLAYGCNALNLGNVRSLICVHILLTLVCRAPSFLCTQALRVRSRARPTLEARCSTWSLAALRQCTAPCTARRRSSAERRAKRSARTIRACRPSPSAPGGCKPCSFLSCF